MNRLLFLLHRYLGIGLGLVVSIWCLSGIVMMYVSYPEMTATDEVATLGTLELTRCCRLPAGPAAEDIRPETVRVEMLAGVPALRLIAGRQQRVFDLETGEPLDGVTRHRAQEISLHAASVSGLERFRLDGSIDRDQWTVYGAYDPHRPLTKFSADDAAGTEWYVSSATGQIVQVTTASERFWNWLGAVPHWLYPTLLRQHTALWSQVVIWLTILGTFLTAFGIYVGIRQYKARRSGRYSPYRGVSLWHHYAGLLFGVFTLTWLVSGFFSMNPWGLLEGRDTSPDIDRYRGGDTVLAAGLGSWLESLADADLPEGTVRVEAQRAAGDTVLVAWDRQGRRQRLDARTMRPEPLPDDVFRRAAALLRPDTEAAEAGWIDADDAYYYSHHEQREFPVYRIVYEDGERFYLDAVSAEVVHSVDSNRRWYRWLHYALHRGDFPLLRNRPVWDLWMLPLLGGVTLGALTGTWMAGRRLLRTRRPARRPERGYRVPAAEGGA